MGYSLWYNAPTMLPAGGRQHRRCIIPLHLSLFLTGTHWLLITRKGQSALPSVHHCQSQLQTPWLLSVLDKS